MWVSSLGGEDPLKEAWQTTPVFLSGEPYGQRSLVGYSPWGFKESDTTEVIPIPHFHICHLICKEPNMVPKT